MFIVIKLWLKLTILDQNKYMKIENKYMKIAYDMMLQDLNRNQNTRNWAAMVTTGKRHISSGEIRKPSVSGRHYEDHLWKALDISPKTFDVFRSSPYM